MDKDEKRAVVAVQMELGDMAERLDALRQYLIDFLISERKNDVKNPNNTDRTGK